MNKHPDALLEGYPTEDPDPDEVREHLHERQERLANEEKIRKEKKFVSFLRKVVLPAFISASIVVGGGTVALASIEKNHSAENLPENPKQEQKAELESVTEIPFSYSNGKNIAYHGHLQVVDGKIVSGEISKVDLLNGRIVNTATLNFEAQKRLNLSEKGAIGALESRVDHQN